MAFREVSVIGVREILRLWLMERGSRAIARHAQVDRKTVRRYIEAAQAAGLSLGDAEDKLTDELTASVLEAVRVGRRLGDGRGRNWELLVDNTKLIEEQAQGRGQAHQDR